VETLIEQVINLKASKAPGQTVLHSVQQFGSTLLGVDNYASDIDLLVCTFDVLYDRKSFF
jgi:predicted nucleotidyltransferase